MPKPSKGILNAGKNSKLVGNTKKSNKSCKPVGGQKSK